MKRLVLMTACALTLVLGGMSVSNAQDDIGVSLNLTYTDPHTPADGGTWQLVAQSSGAASGGISALNAIIDNLDAGVTLENLAALNWTKPNRSRRCQ